MITVSLQNWTPESRQFRESMTEAHLPDSFVYEQWQDYSSNESCAPVRFQFGDYEALSYSWDKSSDMYYTVLLNGKDFLVTQNLYCALQ
jgi:hypothetical protein